MELCCPACSAMLASQEDQLRCNLCGAAWPLIKGVPRFVESPYYWGELPRELMQEVVHRARQNGWREALEALVAKDYPDIYRYVIDPIRADFADQIPCGSDAVALDVGSGWGTISCLLATRYRHVVSVESVPERLDFMRVRASQDALINIQPIQADFLHLPIPASSCDVVVLNGVLEWVGIASSEASPDALQRQFLRKVWTCLRPNGWVYIGIENRFAFESFGGAIDHSGLPYTNLLPRRLADWLVRWHTPRLQRTTQGSGVYRTYTHSYWGYKSLLRKAGFPDVRVCIVLPGYNHPVHFVPPGDHKALRATLRQMHAAASGHKRLALAVASVVAPLGLQRLFAPCFGIFACKRAV
ncbi:MAG: methyltransferase domain-containing protein [Candidatus Binatia bacterium]